MPEFTAEQKLKVAEREVSQRKKVYRGLVHNGRMTQVEADYQIKAMQEIAEDYRELHQPSMMFAKAGG